MALIIGACAFILMLLIGLAWTAGYFAAKALWGCPTPTVHYQMPPVVVHTGRPEPYIIENEMGEQYLIEYQRTARRINYCRSYHYDGAGIARYDDDNMPLFPLPQLDD